MAHWFDNLTKNLAASEDAPRRSFFRKIGAAVSASVVAGVPFANRAVADMAKTAGPLAAGNRALLPGIAGLQPAASSLVTHKATFNQGGLTVDKQLTFDRKTQVATDITTVSKGQTVIFSMTFAVTKAHAVTASANYGAGVQGVKSVTMTSKDGKTFQGSMDGRAYTASRAVRMAGQIQFTDGRPAPQILIEDPDLKAAIGGLGPVLNKLFFNLQGTAVPSHPATRIPGPKYHKALISAPGQDWYEPSNDVVDCTTCETNCGNTYADMMPGIGTIIFCPPCAAIDVAAALAYWAGCMLVCNLPGGGCLPVPCGSFTTCGKGDTCFSFQGGRLCCPAPSAVCNNVCCGTDVTTCSPDGTCGCSAGQVACGNDCCDAGQVCTNGVCCQPGQIVCKGVCCASGQTCNNGTCCAPQNVCGSVCCDELSKCADPKKGTCCSFVSAVCAGQCCAPGSQCINGKCCAYDSVCGGVCCPSGQTCVDPKTHKCAPCPKGQSPCLPDKGAGLCCAPNVACCPGTCCKPGQVCNYEGPPDGSGTYTCGAMPVIK